MTFRDLKAGDVFGVAGDTCGCVLVKQWSVTAWGEGRNAKYINGLLNGESVWIDEEWEVKALRSIT